MPSYLNADTYATSDNSGEVSLGFSWKLDGDSVHTEYEGDGGSVDYIFFPEQQRLRIEKEGDHTVTSEYLYIRTKPFVPNEFIEKTALINNIQAQKAAYMHRFLGTWYFDLTIWTFNDDGTGVWDIPKWGDQPAVQREFSYSSSDTVLEIEWADTEQTTFFWPEINNDGSIMLNDKVKLTRYFDATNCPISTEILSNAYNAVTGQTIYDILGDAVGNAAGDVLGETAGDIIGNTVGEILGELGE